MNEGAKKTGDLIIFFTHTNKNKASKTQGPQKQLGETHSSNHKGWNIKEVTFVS